ncbi:3-dehydroquinate synthase [Roseivivax marinus]|uniref:3-dehydroquinate synthase n=1 Tax=Roseivivax marinus TaxID=1379903 RepID=UPI00273F7CD2|nr:3-dehydroquinate synthase [Roseivivax marinus]
MSHFSRRHSEYGAQAQSLFWSDFVVQYSFPIVFTRGLFRPGDDLLADILARDGAGPHDCLVFIDDGVAGADPALPGAVAAYAETHSATMRLVAPPIAVAGGETLKNDAEAFEVVARAIFDHGIDRHSYVIAIGGGAVLDAVGYAAATAHRGIRHIRVPTTTLSQNDSGVGVKNAINYRGSKNYSGTFSPPWAVLNDFDFLDRLPPRARRCGLAEAVKVALIRDADFYTWLEANADRLARFDPPAEEEMIRRCAALHTAQITGGGDPFERGSARPLDFGHWAAHKLEMVTSHEVLHGEAVAIGIALDTHYSVLAGHLAPGADARVAELLERLGFTLYHPGLRTEDAEGRSVLLRGLAEFREHLGGELTITLLSDLGTGLEVHEMDEARVLAAIDWLQARADGTTAAR